MAIARVIDVFAIMDTVWIKLANFVRQFVIRHVLGKEIALPQIYVHAIEDMI